MESLTYALRAQVTIYGILNMWLILIRKVVLRREEGTGRRRGFCWMRVSKETIRSKAERDM